MTTTTPTTDQVRSIFIGDGDWTHTGDVVDRAGEFDRWLAEHDRLALIDYEERRSANPIHIDNIEGKPATEWLTEHDRAVAEKTLLDYADLLDGPTYTMNYASAESMLTQIIGLLRRDAKSFRSVPKENE